MKSAENSNAALEAVVSIHISGNPEMKSAENSNAALEAVVSIHISGNPEMKYARPFLARRLVWFQSTSLVIQR